jgi:hypothetical protein
LSSNSGSKKLTYIAVIIIITENVLVRTKMVGITIIWAIVLVKAKTTKVGIEWVIVLIVKDIVIEIVITVETAKGKIKAIALKT